MKPAAKQKVHPLLALLAFNRLVERSGLGPVRVVAELLEQRHTPLAVATGADDFVVSDELGSLMIAQISERHELESVFRTLFDYHGENIELSAVDRYGAALGTCFADVVAAASTLGHTALGYRRASDKRVVLNPPKSAPLLLTSADEIVVLRAAPIAPPGHGATSADGIRSLEKAIAALGTSHVPSSPLLATTGPTA